MWSYFKTALSYWEYSTHVDGILYPHIIKDAQGAGIIINWALPYNLVALSGYKGLRKTIADEMPCLGALALDGIELPTLWL